MASNATSLGPDNDLEASTEARNANGSSLMAYSAKLGPANDQLKTPASKLAQKDGATLGPTEGSDACNFVFKTKYLYYRYSSNSRHSDTERNIIGKNLIVVQL